MIARAVAYAHARLVVHQDLKPSNILVTDDGDVKLLDFGIAELYDRDASATRGPVSKRPLTPAYASPEQLAGQPLSVATDVYSSGVVLYELLTGGRPSSRDCPRRPSDVHSSPSARRAVRGDLDAIVLKALAHRPEDRYATMDALADNIERHLHHHPVAARPDRVSYRFRKLAMRHTGAVVAVALVLAAVSWAAASRCGSARRVTDWSASRPIPYARADRNRTRATRSGNVRQQQRRQPSLMATTASDHEHMLEVVPYDPTWPTMFEVEAHRIRTALGQLALRVDHLGSTSIPGLGAKPIIEHFKCQLL